MQLAADDRGEPIPVDEFHARIVGHCADALSMHARHRAASSLSGVGETEAQIRRQRDAALALDDNGTLHVAAWWEQSVDSADPWKAWATLFLLGSTAGPGQMDEIVHALERIPEDDEERWAHAAEALALASVPNAVELGHELIASPSATARAVGLDVLSRLGLLSLDTMKEQLRASAPAVAASAARSVARAGVADGLVAELLACHRSHGAAAAWEAARALTLAGVPQPYLEIQGGGPLASTLGVRGVEILIMAGEAVDIGVFETLISGAAMTPQLLSAVARFGNVTVWSFLAHHLADPDLAGAAVDALRTLFGDLVPDAEATSFPAWKREIAEANLNPLHRYRRGMPWRPTIVLEELARGGLSRVEAERRVDELAARTGVRASVDLGAWEPEMRVALGKFDEDVRARGGRWQPGAWR